MSLTRRLVPVAYRGVLGEPEFRRLLAGLAVSYLGDGMSVVAVAWLALELAPPDQAGLIVGAAVAAYTLPAVVGAVVLMRWRGRRSARHLVIAGATLRALALGTAAVLHLAGWLTPTGYVLLLGASALLAAWSTAGTYTLISQLFAAERRLAANSLASTCLQVAWVLGPSLAGVLVAVRGPGLVLGLDALSYVVLAVQTGLMGTSASPVKPAGRQQATPEPATPEPAGPEPAVAGFRILARRPELVGLLAVTAVFFFLYGPVEVALPLYIATDIGGSASLLGAYWAVFGLGAVVGGLLGGLLATARQWPFVVAVVAGWGLVLIPFGLTESVWFTMACFAVGGLIYGPFPAFTLVLFQNAAVPERLPAVLAARSVVTTTAVPVGAALGGPLVAMLGAGGTLLASGTATVAAAGVTALVLLISAGVSRRPAGGNRPGQPRPARQPPQAERPPGSPTPPHREPSAGG